MKLLKKIFFAVVVVFMAILQVQCKGKENTKHEIPPVDEETQKTAKVTLEKEPFGTLANGEKVDQYILKNSLGMEVRIITYGGIITSLKVPDKDQIYKDVVLGYDSLSAYTKSSPYFGAIIGRYGNRIAKGTFSLDGKVYSLAKNDGSNHLHGGVKGFDKVIWTASEIKGDSAASLILNYISKDMEEGYPGNLNTTVAYTLHDNNSLEVAYTATTDKKTVVNLTQHSYFNLSGDFQRTILDQVIQINADAFIPVDGGLIPTGELRDVKGTPFDFRSAKTIGKEIAIVNDQLKKGLGYDHCWVLNEQEKGLRFAASAYDPVSGRLMEVFTDEPGIQFYTGNFLDGTLPAKGGGKYAKRTGFCLETQHYPDSPNQQNFPSVVLSPGEQYTSKTIFKFSTK